MSASPYVFDVTQADFESRVLAASTEVPVLVDFWAPWCAPCRALAPVLDKLASEFGGQLLVAKVNTDEQMQLAALFGVRSLPTVMLIRDGRPVDGFMGAQPESAIREFLAAHLGELAPGPDADDGASEPAAQSPAERIAELERLIASEPDKPELKLDLAEALAASAATDRLDTIERLLEQLPAKHGESDKARRVRSRLAFLRAIHDAPTREALTAAVAGDPRNLRARHQLGARLLLDGDWAEALDQFLALMQADRRFDDDLGRRALVAAFDLVEDPELVSRTRRRMASLLF